MGELQVIEQNGQRVLTTTQLAEFYGVDNERIIKNFNRNRERYVPGKHYILIEGDGLRQLRATGQIDLSPNINKLYLWTEKGAWLHAKSLNTDQAWDAYETLVDDYYTKTKALSEREQLIATMKLSIETSEEIASMKEDVTHIKYQLDNQMTIDYGQQATILNAKNKRVETLWGDGQINTSMYDTKRKVHAQAWRDLKLAFGVASYRDIRRKDFEEAMNYIKGWRPRWTA